MNPIKSVNRLLVRTLKPARLPQRRPTQPASDVWGADRGRPVDRFYIERFLSSQASDIKGRVLEVHDNGYTRRFGRGVTASDVLDINADNPNATVIADLARADNVASETFDCFILTQTLQFIYEYRKALEHTHRILKKGGVLLATVPVVSQVDPDLYESDYWRFTPQACVRLFAEFFGQGNVSVIAMGNLLSCLGFINGMAQQEFSKSELEPIDSRYPLITAIRAVRAEAHPVA